MTLLIPTFSFAGDSVNETLSAESDGVVEIHNVRGDIKIIGWDKDEVSLSGELDDLTENLVFESRGKVTLIKVEIPKKNINHGDGSNLVINVPKSNRVDFNGISTDLIVKDISGGIDLRTISGDLDLSNLEKQISVNTISGDIRLKNSSGNAKIDTVSGEVEGNIDSKESSVNSVSGDVKLNFKEYNSLVVSSISGEIWISGQQLDSGKTSLSNVSGDITLAFNDKVNARAHISAGPGGEISNNLSSDKVKDIFPNQQKLSMTLGDGSGRIKIGTVNGSITLRGDN
jgi:DUF4097 and DUF4098 domain-containing protein YvlB